MTAALYFIYVLYFLKRTYVDTHPHTNTQIFQFILMTKFSSAQQKRVLLCAYHNI